MQRFGTYSVRTHEVGIQILKQNWAEVIRLILSQTGGSEGDAARKQKMLNFVFEKGDVDGAIDICDKKDVRGTVDGQRLEKSLLVVLKKTPAAYYNAFQNIARNTRTLYVHAYQSYIWNKVVSARIKKFGRNLRTSHSPFSLELGDFVFAKEDVLEEGGEDLVEVDGGEEEKGEEQKESPDPELVEITEENRGQHAFEDVVMPVFGFLTK